MNEDNNKNKNQRYILTRETLGMTFMLFSIIIFVMLLTRDIVFSSIGTAVCTFMYGTFGYGSYLVLAMTTYLGVWLVWEKSIKISAKCALSVALSVFLCFLLFHSVTARNISVESFGTFISLCYNNAAQGFSGYTFGGVISAIVVYPIAKLTTFIGAYIIFGALFAGSLYLSAVLIKDEIFGKKVSAKSKSRKRKKTRKTPAAKVPSGVQPEAEAVVAEAKNQVSYADPYGATENYQIVDNVPSPIYVNQPYQSQPEYQPQPISQQQSAKEILYPQKAVTQQPKQSDNDKYSSENLGRKIIFDKGEFAAESYRRNMIFDEDSYFNKPARNENNYMSSFGGGSSAVSKSSSGSGSGSSVSSGSSGNFTTTGSYNSYNNINNSQPTYSETYRQSVESGTEFTPSSYVYGDKPVEKLDDSSLTEGVYREDSVIPPEPESPVYRQQEAQSPVYRQSEPERTESRNDFGNSRETSDYNEHIESTRGYNSDAYNELQADSNQVSRRAESRSVPEHSEAENLFNDNLNRSSDIGAGYRRDENPSIPEKPAEDEPIVRENRENLGESGGRSSSGLFGLFGADNPNLNNSSIEPDISRLERGRQERSKANLFDEEEEGDVLGSSLNDRISPTSDKTDIGETGSGEAVIPERRREMVQITPPTKEKVEAEAEAVPVKPKHVWKRYVAPPIDLLQNYNESGSTNAAEIEQNKQAIVDTLANVRIESEIINVIVGSKFTRYDVKIKDNTAIKIALKHKDEIQIALRKDTINAYINFKLAALSIEVPNRESGTVGLKSILSSGQFLNSKAGSLTFALGKNIEGDCICPDITKMPHLLVAGTTGSGKSICLSSLIISLIYKYGPDELRFILIDPKQVEFIPYENLPHLMINEIIFDVDKAIKALNWAIKEMERRYQLFKDLTASGVATKDINEYNSHVPEGEEKLPKVVIILDEFGDLMLQAKKEIETRIVRLVQKARACGIHLILATQRPSVDCITGLIKSNLSTRIGFKVNSLADSSTIFDVGGAEKLLGAGDMYYRRSDRPDLQRVQGCFISSSEVQKVTDFVKANNETYYDDSVSEFINAAGADTESSSEGASEDAATETDTKIDDTFINALKYCVTSNQASVSMIQRRFPVGYIKACKIIDWMENMNYITQSEGSKPRKVLLSREEFTNIYGDIDD